MRVSLIVAMSENGVIGRDGQLPWRLSADLKRFRALTTGHTIIMGRRTYDSIGRPLPDRRSIVITRNRDYHRQGVTIAHSLDEAIQIASHEQEIFIIGGGEIYAQALTKADRLHVTRVHAKVEGDATFPAIDEKRWKLASEEHHPADERNEHPLSFCVYERC